MEKPGLLHLTSLVVGTIIGAGVLAVPYAVAKSGFLIGSIHIFVISILMVFLHLAILKISFVAREKLQLVGIAEKFFGRAGKAAMGVLYIFSIYGALLAYIIGVGISLSELFGGKPFFWSIVFFAIFAPLIRMGIKSIAKAEFFLSVCLIIIITIISLFVSPMFDAANLKTADWSQGFLPFGVVFFALFGFSAIPVVAAASPNRNMAKKAVIFGTVLPAILYLIFTATVLGVTGASTTEIATIGIGRAVGRVGVILGNLFAVFAMSTSFLGLGLALKEVYMWDLKLKHNAAWSAATAVPIILFFIGGRSFIATLEFTGSFILTTIALMVVIMYIKTIGSSKL